MSKTTGGILGSRRSQFGCRLRVELLGVTYFAGETQWLTLSLCPRVGFFARTDSLPTGFQAVDLAADSNFREDGEIDSLRDNFFTETARIPYQQSVAPCNRQAQTQPSE